MAKEQPQEERALLSVSPPPSFLCALLFGGARRAGCACVRACSNEREKEHELELCVCAKERERERAEAEEEGHRARPENKQEQIAAFVLSFSLSKTQDRLCVRAISGRRIVLGASLVRHQSS